MTQELFWIALGVGFGALGYVIGYFRKSGLEWDKGPTVANVSVILGIILIVIAAFVLVVTYTMTLPHTFRSLSD